MTKTKKDKPKFKSEQKVWYNLFYEFGKPDWPPIYRPLKVEIICINDWKYSVKSLETGEKFNCCDFELFRTKKEAVEKHLKRRKTAIKTHRVRIRELQKYIKQVEQEFLG